MLHRIFLVRTRPDLPAAAAQEHWRERHAALFGATPGLAGYVQDRPLGAGCACSETWFADAYAELAAYASPYYRETVAADEAAFLDRGSAWRGRVVGVDTVAQGSRARYRVLGFGCSRLPEAPRVAVLHLDRDPPGGGPRQVVSAWVEDCARARELVEASDGLAFAAEPFAVVRPPEADWP